MRTAQGEGKKIRILVADRTLFLCDVTKTGLEQEEDMAVVGQVVSAKSALRKVEDCDVLLVAAGLTAGSPLALTHHAVRTKPDLKVVISGITLSDQDILQHIEAGASGYVTRDATFAEVTNVIRTVHRNEAVVSRTMAFKLMQRSRDLAHWCIDYGIDLDTIPSLTPRERDVVALVEKGRTNQEIADILSIEVGTVKNHIHKILQKYGIERREDLKLVTAARKGERPGG